MTELLQSSIAGIFIAFVTTFMLIRLASAFGHAAIDNVSGPQKFHSHQVSRVGGIGVLSGLLAALLIAQESDTGLVWLVVLSSLPAFIVGLAEDLTKKVGVVIRLLATAASAGLAAVLAGTVIQRLDVAGLDLLLGYPAFALVFTCFAVAGISNAFNIIDGYNGLAGGVAALVLLALAYVAFRVNDSAVLSLSLFSLAGLLGFLLWNYPSGRIFMGDGGAYLIGFLIAEASILLVLRNPQVSPWFPLLLMAYPIWETLFSIYRKKFLRNQSPGQPDGLHLHMLVFKRCLRLEQFSKNPSDQIKRNSATSPYLWALTVICAIPAVIWWNHSVLLASSAFVFAAIYNTAYRRIVRFKIPQAIIRR